MVQRLSLNGDWLLNGEAMSLPGVHVDTTTLSNDDLCYTRRQQLPNGDWTHATLELGGARFGPSVAVNGEKVAH